MMTAEKRIVIIGAGDLGEQIAYCGIKNGYNIVGFYDDTKVGRLVLGLPVWGGVSDIFLQKDKYDAVLIGIGYKHMAFRKTIFDRLCSENIALASILDSSAIVDKSVSIGNGVIVMPGVILDKGVSIMDNVFINIGVTIAHDSTIDNHCFIAPRCAIAGFTYVGESCFLGINSTIINNISITHNVQLGAGAVVVNDCKEPGLYLGIPSKRKNDEQKT